MERLFHIAAALLIGAAAVFFLLNNFDGVFISIVLACLSFFLSVRTQVKGRLSNREMEREREFASKQEVDEAPDLHAEGRQEDRAGQKL